MQVNINSINAQFDWMANNSNNIANINTNGYKAIDTTIDSSSGGVVANTAISKDGTDLTKELTDQTLISTGVQANTEAVKTQDDMVGSLLDMLA